MADFSFFDRASFQKMVDAEIEETLTLEYKASPALSRDSKNALELCKDVSAMANSAGGQIIYGIGEDKKTHKPTSVDDGVTDEKITREWLHQILGSNIHPRIDGLSIQRIPLSDTGFGFVLSIDSTQNGPHQAPDKKYYKRHELEAVAMEDYEVRDILRRATTPDLFVTLSFLEGNQQTVRFPGSDEESRPFNLIAHIENRSPQPAFHVVVDIGIDTDFTIISTGGFTRFASNEQVEQTPLSWLRWTLAAPPGQPIFKEYPRLVTENVILLSMNSSDIRNQEIHDLTVRVVAPGCSRQENWSIIAGGARLSLYPPNSDHTAKRPTLARRVGWVKP
jgi:Schlafen, AlbA_2